MNEVLKKEKELGKDLISDRNVMANARADLIWQEILVRDGLTEEEARILGCDFMAYHCEAILHNEDRMTIEVEAATLMGAQNIPWQNGEGYEWIHDERIMIEKALLSAVHGDYRLVKDWFAREAVRYGESVNGSKYMYVSRQIPTSGQGYQMPYPAWTL